MSLACHDCKKPGSFYQQVGGGYLCFACSMLTPKRLEELKAFYRGERPDYPMTEEERQECLEEERIKKKAYGL